MVPLDIDILGFPFDPHTPWHPTVRVSLDSLDTTDVQGLSLDPHTPSHSCQINFGFRRHYRHSGIVPGSIHHATPLLEYLRHSTDILGLSQDQHPSVRVSCDSLDTSDVLDQWTKVAKPDVAILHTKKQSTLEETMIVHLISGFTVRFCPCTTILSCVMSRWRSRFPDILSASLDQSGQMAFLDFNRGSPPRTKVAKWLF